MSIFARGPAATNPQTTPASTQRPAANTARSSNDAADRLLVGVGDNAPAPRQKVPTVSMAGNTTSRNKIAFSAPSAPAPSASSNNGELRKLIVGRDIALAGEITACDYLIVEGTLDATMRDGQRVEINQNGLFRGAASVQDADIAGRFEGDLTVRGRLRIRATGMVTGRVQYGELEVEAGGAVQGEMIMLPPSGVATNSADILSILPPANQSTGSEEFRATGSEG